ncbi:MAG: MFS transporter [Alphaproteobacteria bacterium]|nr:MFS transporter [Alphaproteobacteria bacterium]
MLKRPGDPTAAPGVLTHGVRANLSQFVHMLIQVALVGATVGMTRTVVPALAESEFGVPKGSFTLLMTFVIAFGFVKGLMNFVAGRLSERFGRARVLLIGWLIALPIPFLILFGPSWNWIIAATVLLGVNQGLTWSMALTAKLDLTRPDQKGLVNGLNEFAGYGAVATASIVTAYLAGAIGPRLGLFIFGLAVIVAALALVVLWGRETLPWAKAEGARAASATTPVIPYAQTRTPQPNTFEVFAVVSWRDKRLFALCQAGLVEKFTDAIVWAFYPLYLFRAGLGLGAIGWVVGIYGLVWGASQIWTGPLSDRVGRRLPIIAGMMLCGVGVGAMPFGVGMAWWSASAALSGLGMALLYPTLGAAVADLAPPSWRGSALGVYRFWRDLGYGFGALALGLVAELTGNLDNAFWLVAGAMLASALLFCLVGAETRPARARRTA